MDTLSRNDLFERLGGIALPEANMPEGTWWPRCFAIDASNWARQLGYVRSGCAAAVRLALQVQANRH
jgi:hypothetical protein